MDSDWTSPGYLAGLCLQYMLLVLEQYNYRVFINFLIGGYPVKSRAEGPNLSNEILLWRILILIIVKKNDTLEFFFYFTIPL